MKNTRSWHALVGVAVLVWGCGDDTSDTKIVPGSLVAISDAGDACPGGGTRITSGLDKNTNGVLDDGEVTSTQLVCTPPNGDTLVLIDEGTGDHCVFGGSRVRVGRDDDGDGTLADGEVEDTHFLCGDGLPNDNDVIDTLFVGDVMLETQADIDAFAAYTAVVGDVIVSPFAATEVSLDNLVVVIGNIFFDSCWFEEGPSEVTALSFPKLEQVNSIDVYGCAADALEALSFPDLERVLGLSIGNLPAFEHIDLPRLETAEDIFVRYCDALAELELPSLRWLEKLQVYGNPALGRPSLEALTSLEYINFGNGTPELACFGYEMVHFIYETTGYLNHNIEGTANCEDASLVCPELSELAGLSGGYRVCIGARNYEDGRALCQSLGDDYDLVTFTSEQDLTDLLAVRSESRVLENDIWMGFDDLQTEGVWTWVSGDTSYAPDLSLSVSDGFWNDGEPNDGSANEDCAHISELRVNDITCERPMQVLCRQHE